MQPNRSSPFGKVLRQFREAAALSQEELAERAGLSARGVSDLERGARTMPRLETVRMLADGLGLTDEARRQLLEARNPTQQSSSISGRGLPALPEPVTSFIGREVEIADIERMIRQDQDRLITLLGPGGVGKTRIAIQVAHRLADNFGGGAVFVDLSPIRSPGLVLPTIASRLGVSEQGGGDLKDALLVALQHRRLLLVLDNLEQVVEAAADIAWLHASFPELVMIVTSRVRLRIAAEHVLPIEPLALPMNDDVDALQQVDAVSLFLARAHAVDPGFAFNSENASFVADIVTKLQGMPLAIELAAARVHLLPVSDLLNRLETQLSVLGVGTRDAPARQRTMRDTISWSYDLLSPMEQAVFRTLAIFPDGCTLETAVAVLGVDNRFSEEETLNAIESLVDSSMLRRRMGPDGDVRFGMLQTLREFGLDQLAAADEEHMARQAVHVAWCTPLARECEFLTTRADAWFWLKRIEAEFQNVREHIAWLIGHSCMEEALGISGSFAPYRALKNQFDEARREAEFLLAHPHTQAPTLARIRAWVWLGKICINQTDTDAALVAFRQGEALARENGERWYLALATINAGVALRFRGQPAEAETSVREGLSIAKELDDGYLIAAATGALGKILDRRGDVAQAYDLISAALAISVSIGNRSGVANCKVGLSVIHIRRGELDRAEALLEEARDLLVEMGDLRDLPDVYLSLADVARLRGDLHGAEVLLRSSLDTARETGNMQNIAHCYLGLARIARLKCDLSASQSLTYDAIHWYERCGDLPSAIQCFNNLAEIAAAVGDQQRAAWCIGAVDSVLADRGISRAASEFSENQAQVERVKSALGEAKWQLHYDRGRSMSLDDTLAEVKTWQAGL